MAPVKSRATQPNDMLEGVMEKLRVFRPRFLYIWVRIGAFPLPIALIAPLSLLQIAPVIAGWVIQKNSKVDSETQFVLQALEGFRGQLGELRKMPGFTLVEVGVKGKVLAEARVGQRSLDAVFVKIGLI